MKKEKNILREKYNENIKINEKIDIMEKIYKIFTVVICVLLLIYLFHYIITFFESVQRVSFLRFSSNIFTPIIFIVLIISFYDNFFSICVNYFYRNNKNFMGYSNEETRVCFELKQEMLYYDIFKYDYLKLITDNGISLYVNKDNIIKGDSIDKEKLEDIYCQQYILEQTEKFKNTDKKLQKEILNRFKKEALTSLRDDFEIEYNFSVSKLDLIRQGYDIKYFNFLEEKTNNDKYTENIILNKKDILFVFNNITSKESGIYLLDKVVSIEQKKDVVTEINKELKGSNKKLKFESLKDYSEFLEGRNLHE